MSLVADDALGALPVGLRAELLAAFNEIVSNFRVRRWEPSELNGGKVCEVVHTILDGYVAGSYPSRAKKPRNMVNACNALANAPDTFPRSVRIGIPRVLIALYEIRNNRSVGHVGGDVDPNHMDAAMVLSMARWVVAELVRVFHDVTVDEATEVVDVLSTREVPVIWELGDIRRVLDTSLSAKQETLLLLYGSSAPTAVVDLLSWTEYGNSSRYRRDVLSDLHSRRVIEFNRSADTAVLTTLGVALVENEMGDRLAA
jgi:hypothetical protein